MLRRFGTSVLLLASIVAAGSSTAFADTLGLTGFTGGSVFNSVDNSENTIGWQFTTSSAINVTALGVYNAASYGAPLTESHEVGLWNSSGTLLASTSVSPSDSQVNSFYFSSVSPVLLAAGQTYTLGALFFNDGDKYISSTDTRTTATGITYDKGVYIDGSTLSDPGSNGPTISGRFGPDFEFTSATSATPEPGSLILLATGLAGVAGTVRRRLGSR